MEKAGCGQIENMKFRYTSISVHDLDEMEHLRQYLNLEVVHWKHIQDYNYDEIWTSKELLEDERKICHFEDEAGVPYLLITEGWKEACREYESLSFSQRMSLNEDTI